MLEIKNDVLKYSINIPTNRKELTKGMFDTILNNVTIGKNYCIVAIVSKDTLFGILNAANNKNANVSVVALIAKIGIEESQSSGFKQLEEVVLNRSSIEMSSHLHMKNNSISTNSLIQFMDCDKELKSKVTKGNLFSNDLIDVDYRGVQPLVYTIDFKIVPINQIHCSVSNDYKLIDPFKVIKDTIN